MIKKFGFIMLLVLISGCVTRGGNFSSDLSWIKEGQTSQSDVAAILGEPFSVGSSSGTDTWTYGYYKHKLLGGSRTKELKFYWDKNKKVKSYSFNSSFPDDKSEAISK